MHCLHENDFLSCSSVFFCLPHSQIMKNQIINVSNSECIQKYCCHQFGNWIHYFCPFGISFTSKNLVFNCSFVPEVWQCINVSSKKARKKHQNSLKVNHTISFLLNSLTVSTRCTQMRGILLHLIYHAKLEKLYPAKQQFDTISWILSIICRCTALFKLNYPILNINHWRADELWMIDIQLSFYFFLSYKFWIKIFNQNKKIKPHHQYN